MRRLSQDKRGDELPTWVANRRSGSSGSFEARAALEQEAKDDEDKHNRGEGSGRAPKPLEKRQRNFTDPDSRVMRTKQTYEQSYNCQIAVDAESQVIVAESLNNKQTKRRSCRRC
jgi:hypothetical protein